MNPASINCASCRHAYPDTALFCPNCGKPKVREEGSDPLLGKVLGERFLISDRIGQGASGTIYRAEHVTLRRKVAIKVLHQELSRDDLAVERFRREATTVAEIDNEHIVEIHDFGRTPDGRLYLAMELLEGEGLDAVLAREGQLSVERVADILIQVGEALMEAHAIGYIHRDLRPRNIYLAVRRGKANFVKLFDFGLAKLVEPDAQAASTSLGMTFGDPRYMSPEQARGDRIDRRADIYQLGCVAYEALTGAPPFSGARVFDILTKQVTEAPVPITSRRAGVPLWMEASIARMLAKNPDNRFATTTRMVEALRRGLETGEVMDEEIARRRESIPPPSVSRVMQKMGLQPNGEPIVAAAPVSAPVSAPVAAPVSAPVSAPVAGGLNGPPLMPAPQVPATVVVDEALPRRRTGTPVVGVPAVAPPTDLQPAVAGSIDAISAPIGATPSAPTVAVEHPATGPSQAANISQSWFAEGDEGHHADVGEDPPVVARKRRVQRAQDTITPASRSRRGAADDDLAELDEIAPEKRRWPWLVGALVLLLGGGALALGLGGKRTPSSSVATVPVAAPLDNVDAAPSMILEVDAGVVAAITPDAPPPAHRPPATTPDVDRPTHPGHGDPSFTPGGDPDPSLRRPGGGTTPPGGTVPSGGTVTPVPPPGGNGKPPGSGVSGTDNPVDPYAGVGEPDPNAGTGERKADFYANLGSQQLASGDTAGAAANFKKALELDGKSVGAVLGLGEIALRQGLFGDAITHLNKAARLAPRNARPFTLLGEAYLNSGNNAAAAQNFKKALQLDPDNARARDGYNEASNRLPPPDDTP